MTVTTSRILKLSLLALLTWPLAYAVTTVMVVLGFVVVPVLALLGRVRCEVSAFTGFPIDRWVDRFAWPWDNREDGVSGPAVATNERMREWIETWGRKPVWLRRIVWSAWRNPANQFKRHWLGLVLDASKMTYVGNTTNPLTHYDSLKYLGWESRTLWVWGVQGWKSGVWVMWARPQRGKYFELRLGWKVYPGYVREVDREAGLTLQLGWRDR